MGREGWQLYGKVLGIGGKGRGYDTWEGGSLSGRGRRYYRKGLDGKGKRRTQRGKGE